MAHIVLETVKTEITGVGFWLAAEKYVAISQSHSCKWSQTRMRRDIIYVVRNVRVQYVDNGGIEKAGEDVSNRDQS